MNRQPNASFALSVLVVLLLASCTTFYRSVVSITSIVDGAAKQYASLYNRGLIPPDVAAKVSVAFKNYQTDAKVAHDALVAYKASGDDTTYKQAFAAVLSSANGFVQSVIPFFYPDDAIALQTQIRRANAL
jgi:hypothetical protein